MTRWQSPLLRRPPWWRTEAAEILVVAIGAVLGAAAFWYWLHDGHVWAAHLLALPFALVRICRVALRVRRLIR
ncbi:hypothetical protein [Streptomyces sp. H27-C3]|uniref:hypothetical protein n=1 Tax=Streptomyces sp. H27-C3 TaxID=3046305 RepID=UPI0024BBBD19|nr:hypothetical protein [Streptomyces sp. H27-C3]MDJ0463259.1 hypothetical protein [Streptomyces sp. H27-C3]